MSLAVIPRKKMIPKWFVRLPVACLLAVLLIPWAVGDARAQAKPQHKEVEDLPTYIQEHYTKQEYRIPMRDGVRLFTAVYSPKDSSRRYPILMLRTPYSCRPYGKDSFAHFLGPNKFLIP